VVPKAAIAQMDVLQQIASALLDAPDSSIPQDIKNLLRPIIKVVPPIPEEEEELYITIEDFSVEAKKRGVMEHPALLLISQNISGVIPIPCDVKHLFFHKNSIVLHVIGLDGLCTAGFALGLAQRTPLVFDGRLRHGLVDKDGVSLLKAPQKYAVGDVILSPPTAHTDATIVHLVAKEFSYQAPEPAFIVKCAENLGSVGEGRFGCRSHVLSHFGVRLRPSQDQRFQEFDFRVVPKPWSHHTKELWDCQEVCCSW
jgi:hypothetical protein